MNNIEFAKLSDKRLSHEARSLYLFYLRPMAERGLCLIDLPALSLAMETISSVCPFIPTENLITDLLNELNLLGFIEKKTQSDTWQGYSVVLPYFNADTTLLPQKPFAMSASWRPSSNFTQTCLMAGLHSADFTESELNSFISYWSGRHELRNQHAWERAFALRLLKHRSAYTASGKNTPTAAATAAKAVNTSAAVAQKASAKAEKI
ncbi:DnaT-like ssDNA-binding domain-containing protein [uncultured Succinatimonas sp.]|uniref:DnaT-like ssDNA-binding domain-containing protein n=1 Tax=uncultured Succinatimonas sp. TaxID=1262973 RepID=UPI0025EEEA14|nr:DnaT-like ssDNA-binding domain-containing protein [uncultured Succinatimonas sp.]